MGIIVEAECQRDCSGKRYYRAGVTYQVDWDEMERMDLAKYFNPLQEIPARQAEEMEAERREAQRPTKEELELAAEREARARERAKGSGSKSGSKGSSKKK